MMSALRGSFLYPFDVVLEILGFRFSLGGCYEKVEISMNMSSFLEKIEISRKSRDFMKKRFEFARGGRLLSSIQGGGVRAWVGEGSTCPSRGKLWLTVYRAHPSKVEAGDAHGLVTPRMPLHIEDVFMQTP